MTDLTARQQALRWVEDGCPMPGRWIDGMRRIYGSDPASVIRKALTTNGAENIAMRANGKTMVRLHVDDADEIASYLLVDRRLVPSPAPEEQERLAQWCEQQAKLDRQVRKHMRYRGDFSVAERFERIASFLRAPRALPLNLEEILAHYDAKRAALMAWANGKNEETLPEPNYEHDFLLAADKLASVLRTDEAKGREG